ncbi:type II secretion system protein [Roseateles amylovorans]|uniref:Prepilin-type N-terminal cleavage/methylation domain-containing protein n=1 Tax=Roseateles amylovorans TaxID=2978473 RepID=A0ABY6B4U3_9BURK|nr:type 4 pilus major pilin [Roseateles amylovorans]UXH80279.1 prepilin-type N-terminal cleavage/methylation domain-containing protein [Roseateles amylovorans]
MELFRMKSFQPFARARSASTRQRGYSLVELSIALAIVSVVIVGSLIGVQRILANNRANALLADVPRINAALLGALSNSKGLPTLSTTQAAALGAFPESSVKWESGKAAVTNSFGGNIFTLGVNAKIGEVEAGRGYVVRMTQIPSNMCATIANGLAPLARGIWVDDTVAEAVVDGAPDDKIVVKAIQANSGIDLAKLVDNCQAGAGTRTINALIVL